LRDNGFVIALMGMASPLNLRPMIDKALATEGPPLFEGRSRAASAVTDDLGVSDGPSSLILDAMNLPPDATNRNGHRHPRIRGAGVVHSDRLLGLFCLEPVHHRSRG
jgi:hypothetical protein